MSDGLGAIYPAMLNAIIALRCLGYSEDDPQVIRARDEFEKLGIEQAATAEMPEPTFRMQPCVSPVWDTAQAILFIVQERVSLMVGRPVAFDDGHLGYLRQIFTHDNMAFWTIIDQLHERMSCADWQTVRDTGGFILIDRITNDTVGAGMLHFALRRASNVQWQALDVTKAGRSALKGQKPCVLWFTGLSGTGKSTIANLVDKKLHSLNRHTYLLDGDNIRHGLNKNLGFTEVDRVENIRRVAEVSKLLVDAGLIVSTAFISPFRAERQMARGLLEAGEFIEIFVDTPIGVAEQRDPKGLYKKARRGELKNFTGIDSPYEFPEHPEIRIDTTTTSPEAAAETIVNYLIEKELVPR